MVERIHSGVLIEHAAQGRTTMVKTIMFTNGMAHLGPETTRLRTPVSGTDRVTCFSGPSTLEAFSYYNRLSLGL